MKNLISKFYIIGFVIAAMIALGLFFQFRIFNTIIANEIRTKTTKSCDLAASEIKSRLKSQAQVIEDAATYISIDGWRQEKLLDFFQKLMQDNSIFYSIYYGSAENRMINGSGWVPPKGFDLTQRPWYVKAEKEKKLIFTEAFVNASKDKLIITVARPVYDDNNKLLGVAAGDASINDIISVIKNYKIGEEGYTFLIDGKGNILAHPDYQYDLAAKLKNIDEISSGLKERMIISSKGDIEVTVNGVKGYLAYQAIENTDWMIGSFIPMSEVSNENLQFLFVFVMILVGSLSLLGFLLTLQRKYIIKPMAMLDQDVKKINVEDNIAYRVPVSEKDPFAVLRRSVNSTLDKSQEFFSELEEERKKLEEILERNTAIVKAIPDLLFVVNGDGCVLDVESSDETLLILPREAFLQKTLWDILPSDIAEKTWVKLQEVMQTGAMKSLEYNLDLSIGQRSFELRMVKSRASEAIVIARDITERKIMEDEIYRIGERLKLAIRAANVGIWEYDIVQGTLVWDDGMYKLYEVDQERFSNCYEEWEQRLHPDDLDALRSQLKDAMSGEGYFDPEFRIIMPDGTVRYIKANSVVLHDSNGNAVKMIGTNLDISERIHYETELIKAKELAEAANIAKSQFLANMSHEIRTPMNGVLGFLELLNHTNPSSEQKDLIEEAKGASQILLYLINDILDYSKIEVGKLSLEHIPFSVTEVVQDAISLFRPKATEKGVALHSMIQTEVPEKVIGDPSRLGQVLNNLIGNAVKFTKQGEVCVTVDSVEEKDDIALLKFQVRDTGIGIREEDIQKLFRSFQQADASTTRKYGGTGLGLAISKELVEMMDGTIGVDSIHGEGSTFQFEVRLKIGQRTKKQQLEALEGVNILLVDGHTSRREKLSGYLQDNGLRVKAAKDASNVITTILSHANSNDRIEAAVIDDHMSGLDGKELAAALKSIALTKDMKLIYLTSPTHKNIAVEALQEGLFSEIMYKPVKNEDLLYCLAKVLTQDKVFDSLVVARESVET